MQRLAARLCLSSATRFRRPIHRHLFNKPLVRNFSEELSARPNLKARLQQFLTRKRRPLAKDDFWAIISWLFVGHGAFLLVGTTTFASVVLLVANSLQIQEYVAGKIGKYLTRSTGVLVSFGSAEPNWKDGKLTFKNVRLVCGPPAAPEKDDNYTQFDITVDRFDVTISMARLLEGRGLARSCDAHGVRGIIDRSRVRAIDGWRYHSKPGDFELDSVTVKDALVNIVSADFRPFSVSILHADLPRLRKAYLLYDILCVESAVGLFDKCLFSIHTPQVEIQEGETRRKANYDQIRHLKIDNLNVDHFSSGSKVGPLSWLQRGTVGIDAFVQLPLNYRKPSEDLLDSINMTFENIKENILLSILEQNTEKTLTIKEATAEENPCEEGFFEELVNFRERLRGIRQLYLNPVLERFRKRLNRDVLNVDENQVDSPRETANFFLNAKPNTLSFKFDLKFRNIKAHIPLHNEDISILSTAVMAKPIVAYINDNRPYIPITCHFQLDLANFEGAWTVYESGIAHSLGISVADALAHLVADKNKRLKRLKRVGLWSMYSALKNMRYILGATSPLSAFYA